MDSSSESAGGHEGDQNFDDDDEDEKDEKDDAEYESRRRAVRHRGQTQRVVELTGDGVPPLAEPREGAAGSVEAEAGGGYKEEEDVTEALAVGSLPAPSAAMPATNAEDLPPHALNRDVTACSTPQRSTGSV